MHVRAAPKKRYDPEALAEWAKFVGILFLVSWFIVDAMSTKAAEHLSKPRRACDNRFCEPIAPPMTTPKTNPWEAR